MTRTNQKKRKQGGNPRNRNQKKKKQKQKQHQYSDSDEPADVQKLLEPCSKDQLINFLCDAALSDQSLLDKIRSIADSDVSHRKVFVHGLSWDTTRETLIQTFEPFGPIEDCNVVIDKATGRTKGYGFVLFESRIGAAKALKQPQKQIKNRVAFCQLASLGPVPSGGTGLHADTTGRKIYISNVHADAAPDKLKAFFSKFGEIESGPMGFDMLTGKSRGFALFVYKTQEGAKKALEDPYKMFEGHQLHVQRATESNKGKGVVALPLPVLGTASQPVLAAVAAAQNLALFSQNPAYGALLGQNPLLAAALNPMTLNPAALNPTAVNAAAMNPMAGPGLGSYGGSPSLLGAYGSQGTAALQGAQYGLLGAYGSQGTASLQGAQYGHSMLGRPGGSYGGM